MSGPTAPDPPCNDPGRLATVARAFPQLPIVVYHGCWPNVQQALGVSRRPRRWASSMLWRISRKV